MTRRNSRLAPFLAAVLLIPNALSAGTYWQIVNRTRAVEESDPDWVGGFAIVHPWGYVGGTPGRIQLFVCIESSVPSEFIGDVQGAMKVWNRLERRTDNCQDCVLWEETPSNLDTFDATTTLIHELGHCAMGLGHVNLHETGLEPKSFRTGACDVDSDQVCRENTSFTESANATEVLDLAGVRGDEEDSHVNQCPGIPRPAPGSPSTPGSKASALDETLFAAEGGSSTPCANTPPCCPPCPGPECPSPPLMVEEVAWFRTIDNNPFSIDGISIDRTTFSRRSANLPSGNFAANGNRGLADHLGLSDTQSVMYSRVAGETVYSGLVSDDVNMVEMANTGENQEVSGNPNDDYVVELIYQDDCASPEQADIEISLDPALIGSGNAGVCDADILLSFSPQGIFDVHYSVVPESPEIKIDIRLNEGPTLPPPADPFWRHGSHIFSAGFESGDFREGMTPSP